MVDFSIVIPTYNEQGNLQALADRLFPVMEGLGSFEVVFVDDGSDDGSASIMDNIGSAHPGHVKILRFNSNHGKSAALNEGFRECNGRLIVMMDADLQDQPEEIPKLANYLFENNLDVVTGWKRSRRDPWTKTLPSKLFNLVVRRFTKLPAHDFNCGLKIMRAECAKRLNLYGQLHRYMLVLLANQGFKIGEVEVRHAERYSGESKFGHRRIYAGLMDFATIFFLTKWVNSPLYFFGFYGLIMILAAIAIGTYFIGLHFYSLYYGIAQGHLSQHPLWILAPILFLASLLCFFFGLVGELLLHLYNSAGHLRPVANKIEFEESGQKKTSATSSLKTETPE